MYGGSWLFDALEGRLDGCNYSIVILHQIVIGIRRSKAKTPHECLAKVNG
jgi:hypothetical protein